MCDDLELGPALALLVRLGVGLDGADVPPDLPDEPEAFDPLSRAVADAVRMPLQRRQAG